MKTCRGLLHGTLRVGMAVEAIERVTGVQPALGEDLELALVVHERMGNEEETVDRAEERAHRLGQEADAFLGAKAAAAEKETHG